jgi:hypothetical protein
VSAEHADRDSRQTRGELANRGKPANGPNSLFSFAFWVSVRWMNCTKQNSSVPSHQSVRGHGARGQHRTKSAKRPFCFQRPSGFPDGTHELVLKLGGRSDSCAGDSAGRMHRRMVTDRAAIWSPEGNELCHMPVVSDSEGRRVLSSFIYLVSSHVDHTDKSNTDSVCPLKWAVQLDS